MKCKSRMFPFITRTWNPLGGRCPHNCKYCWSMGDKGLVKKYNMKKYIGEIRLIEKELKVLFSENDFVFIQDMSDLYAWTVPLKYILKIHKILDKFPNTKFLSLTKNPERYILFKDLFPKNLVLGATIESNRNYEYISNAPPQEDRLFFMKYLKRITGNSLFISIEPILDFDLEIFKEYLLNDIFGIKPWAVAVGYDNYNNNLPEPNLEKTMELIKCLEKKTKVFRKTLRKSNREK